MRTELLITTEQCDVLDRVAEWVVQGGIGGFKNVQQAKATMILALAEGIPIGKAIHEYNVINGRLALKSEAMLARFQNAGGRIEYAVYTDEKVTASAHHQKGGVLTVTWTLADAKRAGLLSNPNWAKHPRAMLKARAVSEAVRAVYPACLTGVPVEEEAYEITAEHIPLARVTEPPAVPLPLASPAEASLPAPQSVAPHPLDPILAPLNQAQLTAFLVERNQLTSGQTYRDLSADYTDRILAQPARFLATAGFAPAAND